MKFVWNPRILMIANLRYLIQTAVPQRHNVRRTPQHNYPVDVSLLATRFTHIGTMHQLWRDRGKVSSTDAIRAG
jgi:hypothetical protein